MTMMWLQTSPSLDDQLPAINTPIVQYIEVLLVLGGVLVLAYVTLRFGLPRLFGTRTPQGGPIQVLAHYRLEPKKTLYLVETGSQLFLIATSERQVEYLTAIAPENAAELREFTHREEASPNFLRQFIGLQKDREV
jgi:flagellar biogenesis protein FliO